MEMYKEVMGENTAGVYLNGILIINSEGNIMYEKHIPTDLNESVVKFFK